MRTKYRFWILFIIALVIGVLVCWIDARPNWNDTGILAGLIFLSSIFLGLAIPKYAWMWALLISVCIPIRNILLFNNYGSILAIIIAFIGAYIGVFVQKLFLSRS